MATSKKATKSKKRVVKVDAEGKVYIKASFNNIIVTFTNNLGQTISWGSAGKAGFRVLKRILLTLHKLLLPMQQK